MKSIVILILCIAVVVQADNVTIRGASTLKPIIVGERVIQGEVARDKQFPHMAFLKFDNNSCGGSLIHAKWVLTASHCTISTPESGYQIELGSIRSSSLVDSTRVTVAVANIYKPSDYGYMDIALLELETPVTFTDNIKPIRLPEHKCDRYVGKVARLSGFGYINDNKEFPEKLQWADLKVITNEACKAVAINLIDKYSLCAVGTKSPSQGMCRGDSGSGLVLQNPCSGDVLIGIAAHLTSPNCEDPSPSGFIRVNYFLDWIKKTTKLDFDRDYGAMVDEESDFLPPIHEN